MNTFNAISLRIVLLLGILFLPVEVGAESEPTMSILDRLESLESDVKELTEEAETLREQMNSGLYVRQAVAQGACIAMSPTSSFVRAAWRPLTAPPGANLLNDNTWTGANAGKHMSCNEVCDQLIDHPRASQEKNAGQKFMCTAALHLYSADPSIGPHNVPGFDHDDIIGWKSYTYDDSRGCAGTDGNPNVCCCSSVRK